MMRLWSMCHSKMDSKAGTSYSISLESLRALIDWQHPLTTEESPADILDALSMVAAEMSKGTTGGAS